MTMLTPQLTDRKEAGLLLARRLRSLSACPNTLIMALARGGVEVGWMMSQKLQLPLEVFLARKLGFPGNREYAIGAVTETGLTWLHPNIFSFAGRRGVPYQHYLDEELDRQRQEIQRQLILYRQGIPLPSLKEYTVILVDDGIATGATFLASLQSLRTLSVKTIVGAIPVAAPDTIEHIRPFVDRLEILNRPDPFISVGTYYQDFPQLTDAQILNFLNKAPRLVTEHRQPTINQL